LTLQDARTITDAIRRRQTQPSDDARRLGGALVGAMRESVRLAPLRPLPASVVRWSVGPEVSTIIGIGRRNPLAFAFDGLAVVMRRIGLEQRHNKMVRVMSRHVGAAALGAFVRAGRSGSRPPFTLPHELEQQVRDTRDRRWSL
jgi:hypothetical protein